MKALCGLLKIALGVGHILYYFVTYIVMNNRELSCTYNNKHLNTIILWQ